jgi:cytochrome oxidase Cu insertion factor (SCO1/SenC/PrrC family)
MQSTLYHLVTGDPAEVEPLLDRMQIARQRDPETGVISHANLFLLIDREGRIAYRLGLGERQQRWLTSALRVLLREEAAPG